MLKKLAPTASTEWLNNIMLIDLRKPVPIKTTSLMENGKIQLSQLILLLFTGLEHKILHLKSKLMKKFNLEFNGRDHLSFKKKHHLFGVIPDILKLEHQNKVTLEIAGSCHLQLLLLNLVMVLELKNFSMNLHIQTMELSPSTFMSMGDSKLM